jgi:hypothetical protein
LPTHPVVPHPSPMRSLRDWSALFILAALSLAGCVTTQRPVAAVEPSITVERDSGEGFWRATYELAEPVRELRFERAPFRTDVFEVTTPGWTLVRDGDADVLRTTGDAARTIVVRFPEDAREREKEYDFFQKFTDGSVAIYTGHLAVRMGVDPDCPDCVLRRFRFIPPAGMHVLAGGKVVRGNATWTDEDGEGAYVYIGSIVPLETPELLAVVDPGLPQWLWEETRSTLPRLFAEYTTRFGASPEVRPLILFNYMDRGASGHSTGGGVLPGQIQLTADGAAWRERSDDALLHLFQFLAHEAAHLWNGRLIRYEGTADAWMHEGSADAFAQRTLHTLGYLDEGAFFERQSQALNECRRMLSGFPLREAAERKKFSLYYSCGNALALFTERATPQGDLFDFWKRMIATVRGSGRTAFDVDDYLAAMLASGASNEDVEALRRFVHGSASADALADMLRGAGVTLTESDPPEAWGQMVARDALLHLLAQHCKGAYGFRMANEGFALTDSNVCGPLPGGAVVTSMGGHDVLRNGASTWNALHERCGAGRPVEVGIVLQGAAQTIEVPCGKSVDALPPYLSVAR